MLLKFLPVTPGKWAAWWNWCGG